MHVDDFMDINNSMEPYKPSKTDEDGEFLKKRITKIAEKAHEFLKQMKVPTDQIFSDPKFAVE